MAWLHSLNDYGATITVTVHVFRRLPDFLGFTALPICPAMLSAHIEKREIGDVAILDEQFLRNA